MELHVKQLVGAIGLGSLGWIFVLVSMSVNGWFHYGSGSYHINAGVFDTCITDGDSKVCYSHDVGAGPYLGKVFGFATLTSIVAVIGLVLYYFKHIRLNGDNILYPGFAVLIYFIVFISAFLTLVLFCTLGKSDIEDLLRIRAGVRVDTDVSICLGLFMVGMFLNFMTGVAVILHLKNSPSKPAEEAAPAAAATEPAVDVVVDSGKV